MGLLGEMLVERGALSEEQLHAGLVASRRGGQRLGTYLMDLGYIDEGSLLRVLADQQGVPYVSEAVLFECMADLDGSTLPESMLRGLRAVPFRQVGDRIQVAMSSPGDARAIDRIANYTQLHVEPFVASDRTVERAIAELVAKIPKLREVKPETDEELLTEVVYVADEAEAWDRLWLPRVDPATLLRTRSRPREARVVLVAKFPSLETVGSNGDRPPGAAVDATEFLRRLGTTATAAEVGEQLVHFAAQHLDRVCLFAVHHGKVSGWMGSGLPLDAADLRGFSALASEPSLFQDVQSTQRFTGPVPDGPVNARVLQILGPPQPTEIIVLPLSVKGHTKGFLLGDVPGRRLPVPVLESLSSAARAAGDALTMVLRGRF